MIQVGKIFQEATPYNNNVNKKPEREHWTKAPSEPLKVCASEWKIKRHGNREPKQILYHPNHINGVQ